MSASGGRLKKAKLDTIVAVSGYDIIGTGKVREFQFARTNCNLFQGLFGRLFSSKTRVDPVYKRWA